jgi:hypothetical protein
MLPLVLPSVFLCHPTLLQRTLPSTGAQRPQNLQNSLISMNLDNLIISRICYMDEFLEKQHYEIISQIYSSESVKEMERCRLDHTD